MPMDSKPGSEFPTTKTRSVILRLGVSIAAVFAFTRCFSFGSGPSGGGCGYQHQDDFNEEICGDNIVDDSLTVTNQEELAQLSGITFIDGSLVIENSSLTNLDDLDDLICVRGTLSITDNAELTSVGGLENLEQVGRGVLIENNDSLITLDGFYNLYLVDEIIIEENDALESLQGLSGLTSLSELLIRSNNELETLEGLAGLNSVESRLEIRGNGALVSLAGLEELSIMPAGDLSISDNPELTALAGLENLEEVQRLFITDNESFASFDGLDSLMTVTYNFWVHRNESLTSLDGLSSLDSIGTLSLWDNPTLNSLAGLSENLELGAWDLERNLSLASLEGFEALVPETGFTAYRNLLVPTCDLVAYRDALQSDGWEGEVCISENLEDECDDDESDCWWAN